jgi:undecaprenyl-diphosphatase
MTIFQAIIYGLVQGIGEFLPISSSGHLVLLPYFFHWQDPGLAFDVALHFGTLIALLAFYWKEWLAIVGALFNKNWFDSKYPRFFILYLVFATLPGAAAGFFLGNYAEGALRNPLFIAFNLSFFGLLLYLIDKKSDTYKNSEQLSAGGALIIGASQAIAIMPGVSRSGATVTAGRALGLDRGSAAKFSFLISAPIIFGAFALKSGDLLNSGLNAPIITGIISASLSGYFAIAFLLKFVQTSSYKVFFWYRLALAGLILLVYFQSL